jgi:Ca2+-binding EF-hand superfamily protein
MRALIVAAILCGPSGALRTQRAPDADHLIHEAVDHADHVPKPGAEPHKKDFAAMDADGNGQLSADELMYRQFSTGCEASESQIRAVDYMKCGDTDGSNSISPAEFEASMQPGWVKCVVERNEHRSHGFMRFFDVDADFSDSLSGAELRLALQNLWGEPGQQLRQPFMKCVDTDKDQKISQKEFHDAEAQYNPATRKFENGFPYTNNKEVLACLDTAMVDFDANLAFAATDRNKDKRVSKSEAYAVMGTMPIAQPKAQAIFEAADLNKDGYLDAEEFKKAGESYKGEGESFVIAGAKAPAPLMASVKRAGMARECGAQSTPKWLLFSDKSNSTAPAKPLSNATNSSVLAGPAA